MHVSPELLAAVQAYCDEHTTEHNIKWSNQRYEWVYQVSQKYIKVIRQNQQQKDIQSVHCFIQIANVDEKRQKWQSGDIFKPKGWNGPTKNFSRGNVFKKDYQIGIYGI